MSLPTAPDAPDTARPHAQRATAPRRSDRFYAWIAGLGVARSDGWVGGVAAGVAARLGIDPLIVRGVLVVATLCGLPMILIYALAWGLLPDHAGRVHLRDLFRGRFQPAQLGILAGAVAGLLTVRPLASLLVEAVFNPYWYQSSRSVSGFRGFLFIVGLVLVTVLLVFIVRAARRTPGVPASDPRTASAVPAPPIPSATAGESGIAADAERRGEDAVMEGATTASPFVPSPGDAAEADALEAWRAQHAGWQEQDQAWRRQQQDADRSAREQARLERQAAAAAFAAEAAERRRLRRAGSPRASAAYVATTIGLALITGAAVWLLTPAPGETTAALSLFCATLVFAFSMIISGVARRRSGFLAFCTVVTLFVGLLVGGSSAVGDVRLGDAYASNGDPVQLRQPFGTLSIDLGATADGSANPIVIDKGDGYTGISVWPGTELQLTATVADVDVTWTAIAMAEDGTGEGVVNSGTWSRPRQAAASTHVIRETVASLPLGTDGQDQPLTPAPVTITQRSGVIAVTYYVAAETDDKEIP